MTCFEFFCFQGYFSVTDLFQCKQLRQIRGDNYCALRSTLFQVLVGGHRVTLRWPGLISIVDRLHKLSTDSNSGLEQWTFAERLAFGGEEDKFSKVTQCVLSLYATVRFGVTVVTVIKINISAWQNNIKFVGNFIM